MTARLPRRVLTVGSLAIVAATIVQAPAVAQNLTCNGEPATIVGTPGPDRLVGTPGADVIMGLGGADVIVGAGGNDVICGGWGPDIVTGGIGDDTILGGQGPDSLTGGVGNDRIQGGPGRDMLIGNGGSDTLIGGTSGDSLAGGIGNDTLRGGLGPDRVVGGSGRDDISGGGGNDVCAASDSYSTCESPTASTASQWGNEVTVDRVLHVSIDGLRSDHVTEQLTPNLSALVDGGASTMNARTDPDSTKTLPNHTSQFTGRPVFGVHGHGVEVNEDLGGTVHDTAGVYASSVFDVANANGVTTAMYSGKEKFELHERSWGPNIDVFIRNSPVDAVDEMLGDLTSGRLGERAYVFVHIRLPDSAGHTDGWGSREYRDAVAASDELLGKIVKQIEADVDLASSTGFVVTADHGGPTGAKRHSDITNSDTYRIPFVVYAQGVAAGADLYALNKFGRAEPGNAQPALSVRQPIRGHEAGNLALDLLGLPAIDGSFFNVGHDLRLD